MKISTKRKKNISMQNTYESKNEDTLQNKRWWKNGKCSRQQLLKLVAFKDRKNFFFFYLVFCLALLFPFLLFEKHYYYYYYKGIWKVNLFYFQPSLLHISHFFFVIVDFISFISILYFRFCFFSLIFVSSFFFFFLLFGELFPLFIKANGYVFLQWNKRNKMSMNLICVHDRYTSSMCGLK